MVYLFVGVLIAILILLISSIWKGAPYLPTHDIVVTEMLKNLTPDAKFADIGSGDGKIVIAAARKGAQAVGYEINPLLVLISRYRIKKNGLSAQIYWKSFWDQTFSDYDFITLFGITKIMPELEAKLKKELKPGSTVVSYAFHFPNWQHTEKQGPLYIYRT